jgi:hypothetical protein
MARARRGTPFPFTAIFKPDLERMTPAELVATFKKAEMAAFRSKEAAVQETADRALIVMGQRMLADGSLPDMVNGRWAYPSDMTRTELFSRYWNGCGRC